MLRAERDCHQKMTWGDVTFNNHLEREMTRFRDLLLLFIWNKIREDEEEPSIGGPLSI